MFATSLRLGLLACCSSALLIASWTPTADAQVRMGRRGVTVRSPYVGVRVGPYAGVRVRAPGVSVVTPGRYYPTPYYGSPRAYYRGMWGRPSVGVTVTRSPQPGAPTQAAEIPQDIVTSGSQAASMSAGPTLATAELPLNSVEDSNLRLLSGAELHRTFLASHQALHNRLDLFNGGDGWQKYFALPERALVGAATDLAVYERLSRRLESVTRDPQYSMIAALDEFHHLFTVTSVLLERGGAIDPLTEPEATPENSAIAPAQEETLPAPQADDAAETPAEAAANSLVQEHSVLKKGE